MDTASTHLWQRYNRLFLLAVLGTLLVVMGMSLQGGLAGFDASFFGKPQLIGLFNRLRYTLGDKVFAQVLIGKDGWLEFMSNGNLDDYQNALLLQEQMESIHQKLDALHEELAARGITLIVVIAPNKATIYPDKVSDKIQKLNKQSRLDVFMEQVEAADSSYVIDLRSSLMEARTNHQVYYKTDTHWNALGSYIAYREIMKVAALAYPELQPHKRTEFRWKETEPQVMDLPVLMGVDFIREPRTELRPRFDSMSHLERFPNRSNVTMSWANNGQERTLLMYHDSFGVALQPYLQHHFKQAMYILRGDSGLASLSWIDIVDPDIVIIQVVERNLPALDILLSRQ